MQRSLSIPVVDGRLAIDPLDETPAAADGGPEFRPGALAPFRIFGKNPAMTAAMREWGTYCLSRRLSLGMRTRELIIDRAAARCGCEYEFGAHTAFYAHRVGLSADQLRSLAFGGPDDPCWTEPREQAVIRVVDQLHDTATVTQSLWDELSAIFTEPQLLDMLMLAGWYHAISFVARAAQVPLEAGAPTFASLR